MMPGRSHCGALTMKARKAGRVVNAVVLVATRVNAEGHRELLGVKGATSETGAAWNTAFADLVTRGRQGIMLIASDAYAGLDEAITATCSNPARARAGFPPGQRWRLGAGSEDEVESEVTATFGPFAVLFGQDGADEAGDAVAVYTTFKGLTPPKTLGPQRGQPRRPPKSRPPAQYWRLVIMPISAW